MIFPKFSRLRRSNTRFYPKKSYEGGYLRSILREGFFNSKVRPYHIRSILNNLLDMGFIETMGRPRKKSERKNSTGHPQSVPLKLKTTLSEAYFEAPKQGVLRVVLNFEDFEKGSPMEIFRLDSSFGRLSISIERILKRLFNLESI